MPLTNPSELRAFLRSLRVEPKKGFSQNFLIDGNIVRKIVAEASIQPGDTVLEIGPGPGALTEALLAQGAIVYAVEKDVVFADALKRFQNVTVFAEDIRSFDVNCLPAQTKVVSNLPYHLTSPILGLLAPRHDLFSTVTVMVQEEVGRRMAAREKTKDYSSLSVFLRFYSEPSYAFKVSRRCFYPQPKIDSAVVCLALKPPPIPEAEAFFALVHSVFQHRRKMVKSILGSSVETLLITLGENPQARPEELSLATFLEIFKLLS